MKRWLIFAVVFALLAAALVLSERRKVEAPVAPNALLYLVADSQRELTRLPAKWKPIPDKEEIDYGNQLASEIEESTQDEEGKAVELYLRKVGARVAANAHRKLPYKFHYLPDRNFINAFAIPGGHVFMGAGLLSLMKNEDELAAVLGHEIEHIDRGHCAERLQLEAALRKMPLGRIVYVAAEIFKAGYNKDEELEADRYGTTLAVMAGYSPQGAVEIFTEFQKMEEKLYGNTKAATPQEEMSGAAVQILTGYFQSHPPSVDRAAQIQALIAEQRWSLGKEKPLEVLYIFLAHQAEDLVTAAKYDKAIETASTALQLHPGHPPALVALAKASCAKHDFAKALTAYKELLAGHQASADSIRVFADEQGTTAMSAKHFDDAAKFAAFSLELQPNNPASLKLLTEVKLEQADVSAALDAGRKLQKLYPDTASELAEYVNSASRQAFAEHNYARSARFAAYSIQLVTAPQPEILSLLARSEFALADFRAAADAYRKRIEADLHRETTLEPSLLRAYADSLGSLARHADAAREFQGVVRPGKEDSEDLAAQIKIEQAGLMIMAGNESMARSLTEGSTIFAPEHADRLGWWYYRAGKYDAADKVLQRFLSQRPGDAGLLTNLGWVELEQNAPAEAIHKFDNPPGNQTSSVSAGAGRAIASWRLRIEAKETDNVIQQFDLLSKEAPEWTNPNWVGALYGPVAAQTAQEMYAEQQKRLTTHKR